MRVLSIFGTRPEAIKMAPVLHELEHRADMESCVCITGQHREMLDPFLRLFEIHADRDLDLMKPGQTLFDVTSAALLGLRDVIQTESPDLVLVQGDTTSAMAGALAAFYLHVPVGHVEAGLRTDRKDSPFPEEANRRIVDVLADLYFASTPRAKQNLVREGVPEAQVEVTGNTVIDALLWTLKRTARRAIPELEHVPADRRIVLITGHRRESFGDGLRNICKALLEIVRLESDVEIVYPVHLNPNVRGPVHELLGREERIHLLEPLDYVEFVHLMERAYLVLTDSGGIQEEAPSLSKPVLVTREVTERVELLESGAGKLVGTDPATIVAEVRRLLHDPKIYAKMANAPNPFGDGKAAVRIADRVARSCAGCSRGSEDTA
ncbi:MAG: UDP-N-acetylglucosamine 2-epimerase (non-hydrolyzing) [Thermotogota bacterium]